MASLVGDKAVKAVPPDVPGSSSVGDRFCFKQAVLLKQNLHRLVLLMASGSFSATCKRASIAVIVLNKHLKQVGFLLSTSMDITSMDTTSPTCVGQYEFSKQVH